MEHYVITVSRQFGSLGRPIAKLIASKLGIALFDRDSIEDSVKNESDDLKRPLPDERADLPYSKALYPLLMGASGTIRRVFELESRFMQQQVRRQDCIFVGRCSDYVFKDYPRRFSVMIYAPEHLRVLKAIEDLNVPECEAIGYVKEIDKARDYYHRYFTDLPLDTTQNHDMMLDSSIMSKEEAAELIIMAAKTKLKF